MSGFLTPVGRAFWALAWVGLSVFGSSGATSITLFPSADATLIERNPSNSMGAATWLAAGITQNGNSNRALLKFDVAAAVPAGSTITGVGLLVWVTGQPRDGYAESVFSLRRMLRAWNEGVNLPSIIAPGFGSPAQAGDATWTHACWDTNAWSVPGGLEGVDYAADISTAVTIASVSTDPYFFEAGGATTDVQFWLDHPELNFGWMLRAEDEITPFTARRFGARELDDPASSPQLLIDYLPPVVVMNSHVAGRRFSLTFQTDFGQSYLVESRGTLAGTNAWTVLTNLGLVLVPGPRSATDSITNEQRYYRVRRN